MFKSRIFAAWFFLALAAWCGLFSSFNDIGFLAEHWYYPAIMVLGAFVAGLTPEGGGAVAFPMLSVFLDVDRGMARDFSLMIQSIGMTSASIFILSSRENILSAYRPALGFIPVAFAGFVAGMALLQEMPVYIIQALFLSLITAFAVAYAINHHRGEVDRLFAKSAMDFGLLALILFIGGMCASLFGTGADIILYTLLVTRFRMKEKVATHMSIMLMAAISALGYAYRGFVDQDLTAYQIRTWLCAYPVVLFMAPFGAFILHRLNVELMLRGIVLLNIGQLAYFNIKQPSIEKLAASGAFLAILMAVFYFTLDHMAKKNEKRRPDVSILQIRPASGDDGSA